MVITVSINAFFCACLQRERDGRAGATKRKTFYVWRSKAGEGAGCCAECFQVHFWNARPLPPFKQNVAEIETQFQPLKKCHGGSLGLFVPRERFRSTWIVNGGAGTRPGCSVSCRSTNAPLQPRAPTLALRSNVAPWCQRDRDRHITAFVAVESFSSATAAIVLKMIAHQSGFTGRRSCQSCVTGFVLNLSPASAVGTEKLSDRRF